MTRRSRQNPNLTVGDGPEYWSVITNRSNIPTTAQTAGTPHMTSRVECVSPGAVSAIRLVYPNFYTAGTGENPFPNPILVKASIQRLGTSGAVNEANSGQPVDYATFGGSAQVWIAGGQTATTDPILVAIGAGEKFWIKTYVSGSRNAAPSAPSITNNVTTGGGVGAGTFTVAVTYVYPGGEETSGSASTSVVTTTSASKFDVVSPSAATGALGYRVYLSTPGVTAIQYGTDSGVVPFGTNYTCTQGITNNSAELNAAPNVLPGATATYPRGMWVVGGTGNGAANNGEGYATLLDRTDAGRAVTNNSGYAVYSPIAVLGLAPGKALPSLGLIGDSIAAATGDNAFVGATGGFGGFAIRATLNQVSNRAFNPAIIPRMGSVNVPTGGERASHFSGPGGRRRSRLAALASHILVEYGTNDLAQSDAPTTIVTNLLTIHARFTGMGKKVSQSTIIPKTLSTDGWMTIGNQTVASCLQEGYRRQLNRWILRTATPATVTNEPMFGLYAGAKGTSFDFLAGGDGTVTTFASGEMFVQGSETIRVGGVAKTLTTDYTYLGSLTIQGVAYATGVTLLSAPSAAVSVTATYTPAPGLVAMGGPLMRTIDTASTVEVNAAGTAGINGGWWVPNTGGVRDSGTSSGSNASSTFNDTSKAWTTDQHRGYSVVIVTDTTTPTAVGQIRVIGWNTTTQLSISTGWTVTPSSAATYQITDVATQDGTHPTTRGHMLMAGAIDLAQFS